MEKGLQPILNCIFNLFSQQLYTLPQYEDKKTCLPVERIPVLVKKTISFLWMFPTQELQQQLKDLVQLHHHHRSAFSTSHD